MHERKTCMAHMFDDSNEVFEQGLPLLAGDDRSCQVTEDVRTARLNSI